jgi:integrase
MENQDVKQEQNAKQMFLDHILKRKSKGTAKSYRVGIERFEKWYGKSLDTILEERRKDLASQDPMKMRHFNDLLEEFGKAMIDKEHLSINTVRTLSIGVIQFFAYFCVPIKVSFRSVITKKTHVPELSEFRRMFQIADLRGKVIISLGLDLAWRIGDFIDLKKSDIPDLSQECPIQIEKLTAKEKELSSTFISCETVSLLKEYLPNLPSDNEFLFPNRNHGHLDDEKVNEIIQDLSQQISMKIPNGKHFSWHAFRKRFLSTATNLGIDTEVKDLLVGKAIDSSHMTYYGDLKLKNAFLEIRTKALALTETVSVENHTKIENLENALIESQKKLTTLETTNQALREKLTELESDKNTMRKEIDSHDMDILEIQKKLGIKPKPLKEFT